MGYSRFLLLFFVLFLNIQMIFERSITLSREQISENKMEIHFLGLNYTADISINNNIIYRHPGGEYPFTLDLPRDLLTSDKRNTLSVKLNYHLDSESTIPVKQRFMFPHNYGGILKDVFIKLLPNISIADVNVSYTINHSRNSAGFSIVSKVDNREFRKDEDTLAAGNNFSYKARFISPGGQTQNLADYNFNLPVNSDYEIKQTTEISSPALWSPSSSQYYSVSLELYRGNELLDVTTKRVAVYSLDAGADSLTLNNRSFTLNGVTYVPSFYDYGSLYSYQQMERDISIIKEAGFNAVRFAKSIPHPLSNLSV
jgi:beta-galactosidase